MTLDTLTVVFGFIGFFARAAVAWMLWGWFAEPLTGLALSYWTVAGLLLLLGVLRNRVRRLERLKDRIREGRDETDEEKLVDLVWVLLHLVLLYPAVAALGWLLYRIG